MNCEEQSHKTVSTNHNLSEEKGEPRRYRTEVLQLTSLIIGPFRDGEKGRGEGGMEVGEEGDCIPIATLSPPE